MKFYKPEELKAGLRLAKQIYNKQGVLLYERGSVLTEQIIASIQNFGLLGVLILEPAEPLPPITDEEREFEQLQTSYMFRLRDCLVAISKGTNPEDFPALISAIYEKFGKLNHRAAFSQTIRSSEDYIYKHSVCMAILSAMTAHHLNFTPEESSSLIASALLADFGYLYVPKNIMAKKDDDLSSMDLLAIEQYRTKAFHLLQQETNPYGLRDRTFATLTEFLKVSRRENPDLDTSSFNLNTKILMVVDKYDRMTAMSLNYEPVSPIKAIRHLQGNNSLYESAVVRAFSRALAFLPVGQCVELSTDHQGLVIDENPNDVFRPLVLDFKSNKLLDLDNPRLREVLEVNDLMSSMDMRYFCDEETLKQFVPDERLQVTTRRIRLRLERAKKREAARLSHAAAAAMAKQ
ncbi:phosphohydrolase [Lachnospiraceae bacterium 47-T17]